MFSESIFIRMLFKHLYILLHSSLYSVLSWTFAWTLRAVVVEPESRTILQTVLSHGRSVENTEQ